MHKSMAAVVLAAALTIPASVAFAQDQAALQTKEYMDLATALPTAKHTLAEVVATATAGGEVPTEAKFEMDGATLMVGVYTSEKGFDTMAEANVFKEYAGDAAQAQWTPKTEVFADLEHIALSAAYHTLLSMTEVTIPQIIEKASAGGTTVVSVKEKVINRAPVFEVVTAKGGTVTATYYDLVSGAAM